MQTKAILMMISIRSRQFNDLKVSLYRRALCYDYASILIRIGSGNVLIRMIGKFETPICLDESILGYDDLSYAIEYGLIDVLNIKVGAWVVLYH